MADDFRQLWFGPRELVYMSIFPDVIALVLGAPLFVTALIMSHARQVGFLGWIGLLVFALRSSRWMPSIFFTLFSIVYWLAVILPWVGIGL